MNITIDIVILSLVEDKEPSSQMPLRTYLLLCFLASTSMIFLLTNILMLQDHICWL